LWVKIRICFFALAGTFLHRKAFKGCFYDKQIRSKYSRRFDNTFGLVFDAVDYYEQINSKHFKTHFAGKPAKHNLRLLQCIQKIEQLLSPESLKSWDSF
jgi:ribosomal protein S17E